MHVIKTAESDWSTAFSAGDI